MPAHRYLEENSLTAMLATKGSAGVTADVNFREHVTCIPQKRGFSGPTKGTYVLTYVLLFNVLLKVSLVNSRTSHGVSFTSKAWALLSQEPVSYFQMMVVSGIIIIIAMPTETVSRYLMPSTCWKVQTAPL